MKRAAPERETRSSNTPYRDHRQALREKLAALESELQRVRATLAALDGERRTAAALEEEIAAVHAALDERFRLEDLRIAAPCNADWSAMGGDDQVRFCRHCQKHVYDLSKLSRAEAEQLVGDHDAPPPCVRLYKRRDGTVITNDCPVGRKRRRLRRIVAARVGGVVLAGAMLLRWRESAGPRTVGSATPQTAGDSPAVDQEKRVTSGKRSDFGALRVRVADPDYTAVFGLMMPPDRAVGSAEPGHPPAARLEAAEPTAGDEAERRVRAPTQTR